LYRNYFTEFCDLQFCSSLYYHCTKIPRSGSLINAQVYDPYGVTEHQTGTQYNPWQFASGYLDASTLYYKYGTRYYDRFGRWTQKDPKPSANPYVYAGDDPVNVVDPTGAFCIPGNELAVILIGAGVLVFTLLALVASPAVLVTILGVGLTGAQLYGSIAAVLTLQDVIAGFTISSAPVCFG